MPGPDDYIPIAPSVSTTATDSTTTTTTTEASTGYPTTAQKFNSVKLICLISILFLATVASGVFFAWGKQGFEFFPQFLLALATGAWSGLLVVLGVRIEKSEGGGR